MKIFIYLCCISFAFSLTGGELAKQIDAKPKAKDMKANLTMVLTNKKGKTRTSSIRSISQDGGEKQMIYFLSPADDKGVALLKIEHEDKDDEIRLWLPAFKKVRRISSKKKSDAFMGSDLSYEDLTNRDLSENNYHIAGVDTIDNKEYYILETTPHKEVKSEYSLHLTWIEKITLVPYKEKSFDKSGNLLKEKTFVYKHIKNYDTPVEIFVNNVQKNHTTKLNFENIELDSGVKSSLFQEKNLKRLPK